MSLIVRVHQGRSICQPYFLKRFLCVFLLFSPSWHQLHVGCRCLSRQRRWQRQQRRPRQGGLWWFGPSSSNEWSSLVRTAALCVDFDDVVLTRSTPCDHWREEADNGKSMDGAGGGGGRALRWSCVCVCTAHLSHTGNIRVAAVSTLRATTRAISLIHLDSESSCCLDTPSVLGGRNKASTKSQELVELSKLVMSRLNRNQNLTEEATSCLQGAE